MPQQRAPSQWLGLYGLWPSRLTPKSTERRELANGIAIRGNCSLRNKSSSHSRRIQMICKNGPLWIFVSGFLASAIFFGPLAYGGQAEFLLVQKIMDGQQQSLNLNYSQESRLMLAADDGRSQGRYAARNLAADAAGAYSCIEAACSFSGALQTWGAAQIDSSHRYLIFRYSSGGHRWELMFRRVRLVCPSMYPFC
jgi:hypothetical protein